MGRIAFVFSGQGDQHAGMGEGVCRRYSRAAEVFAVCDGIRPGTSAQCFGAEAEALRQTENTQPCLYAMELATAQALTGCGLAPDMAAGFSMGELSALAFAGAMDIRTGFSLVCRRGALMQRDAQKQDTAMAAVLKLPAEQVERIAARHADVYPVNYNGPGQVSVSALEAALPAFCEEIRAAGGRVMPLKVRGGFHSPFMREAGEDFASELRRIKMQPPQIPVYSNVTGLPYEGNPMPLLSRQICSPVRWESTITNMIADGADRFVEIGPGKTLCGMIARMDPSVRTFAAADWESLESLCREASAC